ncbi:MAG: hypothetical protein LBQ06_02605, partial [Frankiaceae bacterium]|nr:hypothetical protein [Frankiaceae bacterium]
APAPTTTAPAPTTTAPAPTTTPPGPACTIAPAITTFIPPLNATDYKGAPLPVTVENGRAQVVTYNPAVWGAFGVTTMGPVTVKGTGQPGTTVTIATVSGGNMGINVTAAVSASGAWEAQVPFSAFPMTPIKWSTNNLSGRLTDADGAWQVVSIKSDCGLAGANIKVGSGYTTPIAIDFSGSGQVQTVSADQAPGAFAFGPDGQLATTGWLAPSAGFLAWDKDHDGKISGIDELFGGAMGDGFAKLAQFDTNGDGVIDSRDAGYWELSIWRDTNMNKVVDPGEMVSLADAGVVSLNVSHQDYWEVDAAGNAVYEHSWATLANGQQAAMNDVYFAVSG